MTAHDPAFPLHALGTTATGLTKRELFAAMAMQGILGNDTYLCATKQVADARGKTVLFAVAAASVEAADALLAALQTE